jgi:omega-3 fatty acid desaturase (delta-15 desaturase)
LIKMKFTILSLMACSCQRLAVTDAFSTTSFTSAIHSSTMKSNTAHITSLEMSDIAVQEKRTFLDIPEQLTNNSNNNMDNDINAEQNEVPSLGTVRRMLPRESFDVDTKTSLFYFGIDFVACVASLGFLDLVVTSDFYHSLPIVAQALTVAPLQILSGFALWCMWCIGHDSGHGTVSKKNWINDVVGEISHSIFCLTPFIPWKISHLKHHLNHNHLTRDYSHQWFIREEADDLHPIFKLSHKTRNAQLPVLYLVYLLFGVPDGGHVFFYGRMWQGEAMKEKIRAALSVAISMTTALSLWMTMGTADFAVVIFAPWLVLSFWLFMVTYLQHHSDDGVLYTDDTWSFTKGAFQTVDRDYGKWINRMSHHMMDGHVVHHLFFAKVPHYKLEEATIALKEGLADIGRSDLYKQVDTPDFVQEIVKQFDENWFFIDEKQVVR